MSVSDYPLISSPVSTNIFDQTYTYDTDLEKEHESFRRAVFNSLQIILSLQAVLIVATNLFLLVVILSKSALRSRLHNQLLISMAASNLTDGIFNIPFIVDLISKRRWIHGCYLFVAHSVFWHYTNNCIIVWGLVLLVVSYLCRLKSYGGPALFLRMSSRTKKYVASLLFVLLPWIIAIPLTFSIALSGIPQRLKDYWYNSLCIFIVERWAEYTLSIFIVVIPAVLMIVLVILTLIVYRRQTVIGGPTDQNTTLEGPSVHVAAAIICIIMSVAKNLDTYIINLFPSHEIFVTLVTLFCISSMMPLVLALLWLLALKDLRAHSCEILARISVKFCKKSTSDSSALVTFNALSQEV
ncbi:uncharacterized protein LOC112553958 isoform X2 [Pomacea canaliculata]|uniref:uncharacterized protein LOC112553958 isoform X2 n=1 Tax=Pomacea canaliculata TaxID=400727 RepID=UPI000D73DA66|nr:uncharacterized protein LOC112553958 isoform X2 [Pomacea canaliculata]